MQKAPEPKATPEPQVAASVIPEHQTSQSLPWLGEYGESFETTLKRCCPNARIVLGEIEGSAGNGYYLIKTFGGGRLFVRTEYERHPEDFKKSNAEARHRLKVLADEDAGRYLVASSLGKYYGYISSQRFDLAYPMRSRNSRSETSLAVFQGAWRDNVSVGIENIESHKIDDDRAVVSGLLVSRDRTAGRLEQTTYKFSVRLLIEDGELHYAGGDFQAATTLVLEEPEAQPLVSSPVSSAPLRLDDESRAARDIPEILHSKLFTLVASDGTFLGNCDKSGFDHDSIFNEYGPHGSKFSSESVFNEFGTYGGEFSSRSPFNSFSSDGPRIFYDAKSTGLTLTANKFQPGGVDPLQFIAFVKTKCVD